MSPTLDLEGRVALVTGASRGIGAEIARTLAAANARVALHYGASHEAARAVADSIAAAGFARPLLVSEDASDAAARRRAVAEVVKGLGAPEILVNNAGFYRPNPFEQKDDETFLANWRATMAVNLEAAAHFSFLALPAMRERRQGRIVMIASRSAFRAETDHPDYAVSKAGMVNLARCLARNEGPRGITANSVCPGWVRTEAVREALDGPQATEVVAQIPLGRVASTADVANAVLYLVSPLGSYVNGIAIPLNGGSYLH
jgi:NAD(P)-dependent dehydrogenase (short-subunit alcohol dehydrogenase family)